MSPHEQEQQAGGGNADQDRMVELLTTILTRVKDKFPPSRPLDEKAREAVRLYERLLKTLHNDPPLPEEEPRSLDNEPQYQRAP